MGPLTTKELQDKVAERQTGLSVNNLPVLTVPKKSKHYEMGLTSPAPISEENIVEYSDEAPEVTGRDLLGYRGYGNRDFSQEAIDVGWGTERFDARSGYIPGANIEDVRAREQSAANKLLRGVTKGGITALTTFANTTLGTIAGAMYLTPFATALGKENYWLNPSAAMNNAVNNPVSTFLTNIQQKSEEILPNFRTEEEQTEEWQRGWMNPSHWNANFWADFIKNFGFTAGAMAGGLGWSKLIGKVGAAKLGGDLMKGVAVAAEGDVEATAALKGSAEAIRAAKIIAPDTNVLRGNIKQAAAKAMSLPVEQQYMSALISAFGEGSAEGLMARSEFLDDYLPQLEQEISERYAGLEDELLQDDRFRTPVFDANNPDAEPTYILNSAGVDELQRRQNELYELLGKKRKYAEEQADELAQTTFILNIPILTLSNAIQFSRLFGGGWKTARSTASGVAGKLGKYKAGAPTVIRSIAKTANLAGTEAQEEMLQGVVSSATKKIAEDNLTYFNDLSFDPEAKQSMREWLASNISNVKSGVTGGVEYLSDWKNWQEGFMGALTGLLGMPGKGWIHGERGGVPQAISEAKQEREEAQRAADVLNARVNSPEFQNNWKGYIRHLKLNEDMKLAVAQDDQYSYHNASDNQLANDVLMFSKAGKLDDLYALADRYSNLSQEDIEQIRNQLHNPEKSQGAVPRDSEIKRSVEKQAKNIKDAIDSYSKVYDDLRAIMPIGTPDNLFDEVVLTTMQLNNAENRFMTLLGETLTKVGSLQKAKDNPASAEKMKDVSSLQQEYAEIFSGSIAPISEAKQAETKKKLDTLSNLVKGDEQLSKNVSDLKKIYSARQDYFDKISKLQTISPEEFEAQAKTQEKEQTKANQDARKSETDRIASSLDEKYGGMNTVEQMHRVYAEEENKELVIETLREKAKDDKNAKDYIDMYDAYDGFRQMLMDKYPKVFSPKNVITNSVLDNLFIRSKNVDDLFDNASKGLFATDELISTLQSTVNADEATPMYVKDYVDKAVNAIGESSEEFRNAWSAAAAKENLANDKHQKEDVPNVDDDDAAPASSAKPVAAPATQTEDKEVAPEQPEKEIVPEEKPEDNTPETVTPASADEQSADSNSTYQDVMPEEKVSLVTDSKGSVKYGYYQQSIPEVPTGVAKEIRELLAARKEASKEEMEEIDRQLSNYKLEDFIVYDENGNPLISEGYNPNSKNGPVDYSATHKWLKDNHAFEYISTKLRPNEPVVFAIMEGAPKYEGKDQIVVAAIKSRNANGEITELQPLTVLHSEETKAGDYMNLSELYDAIRADYDSREPDGVMYIFGGKEKPYTSNVFGKRPGLVRYDQNTFKRIDEIDSYDPDAPIIILNENNEPVLLRGNAERAKLFGPNIYPWSKPHTGRMYYMVSNGNDTYTPIYIERAIATSENVTAAPDGGFLSNIRNAFEKIDSIVGKTTPENLNQSNVDLKQALGNLSNYLNIDGIEFNILYGAEGPVLDVAWEEHHLVQGQDVKNTFSEQYLASQPSVALLDKINRPIRISYKDKWLDTSKKNLENAINEGLITSNAKELRQVGVNFMFDPWDGDGFKRVLDSPYGQQPKKSIAKAEPQKIAKDAEIDDGPMALSVPLPSASQTKTSDEEFNKNIPQSLDGFLEDDDATMPEIDFSLDFDELQESVRDMLTAKGISKAMWDKTDEDGRRHDLFC